MKTEHQSRDRAAILCAVVLLPLFGAAAKGDHPLHEFFQFPPPLKIPSGDLRFSWWAATAALVPLAVIAASWAQRSKPAHGSTVELKTTARCTAVAFPLWGWLAFLWIVAWWLLAWNRWHWFAPVQRYTFFPLVTSRLAWNVSWSRALPVQLCERQQFARVLASTVLERPTYTAWKARDYCQAGTQVLADEMKQMLAHHLEDNLPPGLRSRSASSAENGTALTRRSAPMQSPSSLGAGTEHDSRMGTRGARRCAGRCCPNRAAICQYARGNRPCSRRQFRTSWIRRSTRIKQPKRRQTITRP